MIGKVVGEGKFVARSVFKRDRRDVTLEWAPLVRLLTPHKLFRRSLLNENGIRFPEGRRRLEDHVFTMHAYFHARHISVLAGYPCYHWVMREDDANASFAELEPVGYYANVREVLDLIDEHMEPGPLRDRVRSHWYRGKMLGRVGGANFIDARPGAAAPAVRGDPQARARALRRRGRTSYLAFNAPPALAAAARRRLRRADGAGRVRVRPAHGGLAGRARARRGGGRRARHRGADRGRRRPAGVRARRRAAAVDAARRARRPARRRRARRRGGRWPATTPTCSSRPIRYGPRVPAAHGDRDAPRARRARGAR